MQQQSSSLDDEQPSPLAELTIELIPLSLWDVIEGIIAPGQPEPTA